MGENVYRAEVRVRVRVRAMVRATVRATGRDEVGLSGVSSSRPRTRRA